MRSSEDQITEFLIKFKFFASCPGCFIFVEREKNMQCLAELELNVYDVKEIILGLTYRDYFLGPEPDKDFMGREIWVFGYNLHGEEIYIKLADNLSHNVAKVVSFHKSTRPMSYPYRC